MNERKKEFIRALAEFLVGNEARKSIELQMGKESAKEWSKLRSATPLFGYYPNIEKAVKELEKFLE
jgi:hypothetical protein